MIRRRRGKGAFKAVKTLRVEAGAGVNTVRFKGRVPAEKIKKETLKLRLVATDGAGNVPRPARARVAA